MKLLKILHVTPLAVVALLVLIYLSTSAFSQNKLNKTPPKTHTVTIEKMRFVPAELNIAKGDKVVWINKDMLPHDVTEEKSQKWTSKPFNQGQTWSKVITEDIDYYCNLHKTMKGSIKIIK